MRLLLALLAATLSAEEVYRADFNIKEESGKTRRYTMLIESNANHSIRVGSKMPVATTFSANGVGTQFNYLDTGVSLDVKLRKVESKLVIGANIELSAPLPAEKSMAGNPTMSNVRVNVTTAVTPKKPTLLAAIEDPITARQLNVEVTLTPVLD